MKWNSLKALTVAATALLASSLALAGPDLGEAQQQADKLACHLLSVFGIFVGFSFAHHQMGSKTNHQHC